VKVSPLIAISMLVSLSLTTCHQVNAAIVYNPKQTPATAPHNARTTEPVGAESTLNIKPALMVEPRDKSLQLRLDISAAADKADLSPSPSLYVPKGWRVNIDCFNHGTLHSVLIVPYNAEVSRGHLPLDALGRGADGTKQSFLFRTITKGAYALVCTAPTHHDGVLALIHVQSTAIIPALY
jgi:hypothetical protein